MKIQTLGIGCGGVVFALLLFLGWRLASPWETFRFAGYEVQRNRLTERARIHVGEVWESSLDNDPTATMLSETEMNRVVLSDMAFGPHGYLCGKATVRGSGPVTGRLAFLIVVRSKADGKRREIDPERALRCDVDFAPGPPHPFVINTGMTPPLPSETFKVSLVPVHEAD